MIYDIQNAALGKRLSAWLLDFILLVVLITGVAALVSGAMDYDSHSAKLDAIYEKYEKEYGIDFNLTTEQQAALTEEQLKPYYAAAEALEKDQEALAAYDMMLNLSIATISISVLAAYTLLELILPLILGNGQTLGKKVFGIALMRRDGIKVTPFVLFARTIIGKCTIGTMLPLVILMMMYFSILGLTGTLVLLLLLLLQAILTLATPNKTTIHDLLACTVAVDLSSQMIFGSVEEKNAYIEELAKSVEAGE